MTGTMTKTQQKRQLQRADNFSLDDNDDKAAHKYKDRRWPTNSVQNKSMGGNIVLSSDYHLVQYDLGREER